jgi:hypothetical protein
MMSPYRSLLAALAAALLPWTCWAQLQSSAATEDPIAAFNAAAHWDRHHWVHFGKVQVAQLINARSAMAKLSRPLRLTVVGHAGQFCEWPGKVEPPPSPEPDYAKLQCDVTPTFAQALSEAHAKRIASFLAHGLPDAALHIEAAGLTQPLVEMPSRRPQNRAELAEWNARATQNNRVELRRMP